MQLQMFAVYDNAAAQFHLPFFQPTSALALRHFTDACNDADHPYAQHPECYTLYHIGTFDGDNATLTDAKNEVRALAAQVIEEFEHADRFPRVESVQ